MANSTRIAELSDRGRELANTTSRAVGMGRGSLARPAVSGVIGATVTRWRAEREARALRALANRSYAEAEYFDAQVQLIDSYIGAARAADVLQELPEILALDRATRQAARAEQYLDIAHGRALAKYARSAELAQAKLEAFAVKQACRGRQRSIQLDEAASAHPSAEDANTYPESMSDDGLPDEEDVIIAAKVLRRRRPPTAGSPSARLRQR